MTRQRLCTILMSPCFQFFFKFTDYHLWSDIETAERWFYWWQSTIFFFFCSCLDALRHPFLCGPRWRVDPSIDMIRWGLGSSAVRITEEYIYRQPQVYVNFLRSSPNNSAIHAVFSCRTFQFTFEPWTNLCLKDQ